MCTDHVVVKWESDDQVNKLYRRFKLKAIELAEATSNRNAGKELVINKKLVCDWRKKKGNYSNYQEQAERSGRSALART